MRKLKQWCGCAALAAATGLVAVSGQAEQMYAWTTEDGVYAYTDDLKKVPSRYKDQMRLVAHKQLSDYQRFTANDAPATERYATRLAARLGQLRAMNGVEPTAHSTSTALTSPAAAAPVGLSIATGSDDAPFVNVTSDSLDPVVVEPLVTKRAGDSATRRTTVVSQGDRTLAVVKGQRNQWNVNRDVVDERDL